MNLIMHTERLLLTPFAANDDDVASEMYTDSEVLKYACGEMSESEIRQEMLYATKRGGNGGIGTWCVADRQTGEKLGIAYLLPLPIDEDHTDYNLVVMGQMPDADIEMGYFFKRSAWGQGYATEVCDRVLRFAFEDTFLEEVVASVQEGNVASKRVLEKSGLIDRGKIRCYGKDSLIYRISRDEWEKSQRSIRYELPAARSIAGQ